MTYSNKQPILIEGDSSSQFLWKAKQPKPEMVWPLLFPLMLIIYLSRAIDSFIKCTISGHLQQQATNSNSYGRRCKQQIFMEGEATETRNGLGFCFSSDAHKSVFFAEKTCLLASDEWPNVGLEG